MTYLSTSKFDDMPRGTDVHSPTEDKIIRLNMKEAEVHLMEECINMIIPDMRKGILDNIIKKEKFPLVPSDTTWKREKQAFIVNVAHRFGIYKKPD